MFVIFRNLYFYVQSWNIFEIFFFLNFSHLPFYVNVFNMCSESREFTFLYFLKIYCLLKSWISYLLYSICSSHMCIHDHHGSLNPKLVLSQIFTPHVAVCLSSSKVLVLHTRAFYSAPAVCSSHPPYPILFLRFSLLCSPYRPVSWLPQSFFCASQSRVQPPLQYLLFFSRLSLLLLRSLPQGFSPCVLAMSRFLFISHSLS